MVEGNNFENWNWNWILIGGCTFAALSVEALLELKDLFDSGEKVGDNVELGNAKAGRVRQ